MTWLTRLGVGLRAHINHWQRQNPEELLEDINNHLELELIELRRALAAAIAAFKSTERQNLQRLLKAQQWYEQAQMYVQQGQESQARTALQSRQEHLIHSDKLQQSLREQEQVIQKIRHSLKELELKYSQFKAQKSLYLARLKTAIAQQKLQQLGQLQLSELFEQLELKILTLEAENDLMTGRAEALLSQSCTVADQQEALDLALAELKAHAG
jgi:phage shock protein A